MRWEITVEGGFVTSRRAGGIVFLITRHTPSIDGLDLLLTTIIAIDLGKVTGYLHARANPDFRISESGDFLRLVTTIWTNLQQDAVEHFLHPVSDALLLGLGQDQSGRVKLELFEISSLSNPTSLDALILSEDARDTYSEARYDPHAFTYLATQGDY